MKLLLILLLVTSLVGLSFQGKDKDKEKKEKILGSGKVLSGNKAEKVLKKQIGGNLKTVLDKFDKDNVFVNYDETNPTHVEVMKTIIDELKQHNKYINDNDGPEDILRKEESITLIANYIGVSEGSTQYKVAKDLISIIENEDIGENLMEWTVSLLEWAKNELGKNQEIVQKAIELENEQLVILKETMALPEQRAFFMDFLRYLYTQIETQSDGKHWQAIASLLTGLDRILKGYNSCPQKMTIGISKLEQLISNAKKELSEKKATHEMTNMFADFFWEMQRTAVNFENPCEVQGAINIDNSDSETISFDDLFGGDQFIF